MYLEHFGLIEAPFKITPHTEFFFAGAKRGETLDALIYAIMAGEGIVKVTGEVGAGKTMLCRVLMERLPDTVETIYLAVPTLTRDEMLAVIAGDLDIDSQGVSTTKLIRALQQRLIDIHAQGKHVVALIDEAHAMPLTTLEELRLLSNLETSQHKLLQIVMFGQEELNQHLLLPSMRQLKERITHSFNLLPLPARDIKDYLSFRLRAAGYKGPDLFTPDALKLLSDASEGLTRRINIYADKTLLAAFAENTHTVTADHVRAAIRDTQIISSTPKRTKLLWLVVAALLTGLVVGAAVVAYFVKPAAPPGSSVGDISKPAPALASTAIAPEVMPGTNQTSAITNLGITDVATTKVVTTLPLAEAPELPNTPIQAPLVKQATEQPITIKSAKSDSVAPVASGLEAPKVISASGSISSTEWLTSQLTRDRERMAAIAGTRYSIQLMIAEQEKEKAILAFWNESTRELSANALMIYPRGTTEKPYVSVIYGEFENLDAANTALDMLPTHLKKFHPYSRSFNAIRQDIRP